MLTPSKLRAYHAQAEVAPFAPIEAKDCELLALAVEIADLYSRYGVLGSLRVIEVDESGRAWLDSDCGQSDESQAKRLLLTPFLRYLELRGLLIRKDGAPHVVSFRSP